VRRLQVLNLPGGYPGREAKADLRNDGFQRSAISAQPKARNRGLELMAEN